MREPTVVRSARSAALVGIGFASAGALWLIINGRAGIWWTDFTVHMTVLSLFSGVVVWLVIPRQPWNRVMWLMALSALFGGINVLGRAAVDYLIDDPSVVLGGSASSIVPASLPTTAAWVLASTEWTAIVALFPLMTLGTLLMPDGKLPSHRWRPVAGLTLLSIAVLVPLSMWDLRPWSLEPTGRDPVLDTGLLILLGSGALCLVGMFVRFRASSGVEREQIKWVVWGASVLVAILLSGVVIGGTQYEEALRVPAALGFAAYVASFGIAIGKYRLYDVDAVISRTLVYGALAAFIGAVYVAIVVGAGRLVGAQDDPNPVLAIGATTVVAVAFQPLRRRLQKLANRLVYGRRATPYEVLSTFSQRIAAVDPGVLLQVARALKEGTAADSVSIWIRSGEELQLIAFWPERPERLLRVPAKEGPIADQTPIVHDGEQLGLIALELPSLHSFSPSDSALVEQVAAGLGLAMRNIKLTEDLKNQVDQLRRSRRRIVAVQDLTRRQLERDLHDGAQQRLVALKIKLGIAVSLARKAGIDKVSQQLDHLQANTDATIDAVRDFARGIYPPLLEAEGLEVALSERARRLELPVSVRASGVSRYPRDVEATIYFCVLEAVQNSVKHASPTSVHVSLVDAGGLLRFEVRDDGVGLDPDSVHGDDLINLSDRLDAIGGHLEIAMSPGQGVVVSGEAPVRQVVSS